MKRVVGVLILIAVGLICIFSINGNGATNSEFLRIHIRANSNEYCDQSVKYEIKDAVVAVMVPLLADCETKEESYAVTNKNLNLLSETATNILREKGYSYTAKASLKKEEFPTRSYGQLTLENGMYDALIIELGSAKGDNWWCVVYPPLCFIESNPTGGNVVYKSKILEIINRILN